MAFLHPDKLVGVARAVQPRSKRAVQNSAVQSRPQASPQRPKTEAGLIENLAFRLRDQHWDQHMNRVARRTDGAIAGAKIPKPDTQDVARAVQAKGQPGAIQLLISAAPPKRNG